MKQQLALSPELSLPLDFATRTIAIFGLRGAGKTNTASVLVEELLDRNLPPVIIDPTDAWWGLRSDYPVFIFGGSHGDVPLSETDGKVVAQFVVTEQVPVILSLRHLRKGAQRRFVTDFCEEIYHLKGEDKNRTALTVIIDECPLFVPQKVLGEIARCVGAVEDMIARGRNSGFGVVLISQRPATINKDVLTQSDAIITHRITSPQDRAALKEWFDANTSSDKQKEILASLSGLPPGKAWVWAPTLDVMEQVQVRKRHTFDSSATPKIGQLLAPPKKLTEVNLDQLKGKMADALKSAKDNDPRELKTKISNLNGEIAQLTSKLKLREQVAKVERVEVPVLSPKALSALDGLQFSMGQMADAFRELRDEVTKVCKPHSPWPAARVKAVAPVRQAKAPAVALRPLSEHLSESTGLKQMHRRMLTALAQHPDGLTKAQILVHASYASSGPVSTAFADLSRDGYVATNSRNANQLCITDTGIAALGDYEPLPLGDELRAWLLSGSKLSTMEKKLLEVVCNSYPDSVSKGVVLGHAGYASSGPVSSAFAKLVAYNYVIPQGPSMLRAAEQLFS